jgi:MFS-type transporter involved in bile tolerance (Atg22 family)
VLDEAADQAQRRLGILTLATLVCICATAALAFTAPSDLWLAAAFFVTAQIAIFRMVAGYDLIK